MHQSASSLRKSTSTSISTGPRWKEDAAVKVNASRIERAKRGFPSSGGLPWGRLCTNTEQASDPSALAKWEVDKDCQRYAEKWLRL